MCSWSFPDGKPSHARGQHGLQSLGVASRERADGARVDGVRDCVWASAGERANVRESAGGAGMPSCSLAV